MSSTPHQFPISLRAWPAKDDKSIPLSTLITRINNERVSFRSVTEESLLDEIRREEAGLDALKDDGESENEDAEEEPDRLKEVFKAREEILMQLEQAHMASMVTLDFVSLLLSKDTPVQAGLSLSQALRDAVSLGTLGVDKVQDLRVTKIQNEEIKIIAKGWKLQSLDEAADSIIVSATRLEKEIEKETKYWEQVLTVADEGWAVCCLPQEKHTLGVRFGFAESAPAFQNRSLGALRRNVDGSIYLDQGIVDATPKRVRVRIRTDGVTTGELSTFKTSTGSESVKSLILTARNTIFEEELWQELNREARALANQGVRLNGDELICPISSTKQIVLDLQANNAEETSFSPHEDGIDDRQAELISLALHLLLSYAHRQNHHRRSQLPQPISNRPSPNLPYNLLRPIIAGIHHEAVVSTLTNLLMPLSQALRRTRATDSPYTCTTTTISSALEARRQLTASPPSQPEVIIDALISNLSAEFDLPLTTSSSPSENQSLTIRLRTALFPLESRFVLQATGPLAVSCKPPMHPSFVEEVKVYILWATACALAGTVTNLEAPLPASDTDPSSEPPEDAIEEQHTILEGLRYWQRTHNPTVLRKTCPDEKNGKEIAFNVALVPAQADAQGRHANQQQIKISVTYTYVAGAADEDAEAVISRMDAVEGMDRAHRKGVMKRVWKSEGLDLNEGDSDEKIGGEEGRSGTVSLRDFIESVGRWEGSVRGKRES